MGNQLSKRSLSASSLRLHDLTSILGTEELDVSSFVYDRELVGGRLLKTAVYLSDQGPLVVKLYFKTASDPPLTRFEDILNDMNNKLAGITHSNCLAYARVGQGPKTAYLIRQYISKPCMDAISTPPFLTDLEKRWLVYQLLQALVQAHSVGVCHGDIKSESFLVTSWGWAYLTDFAPFKPTYLPESNPALYSYFFHTTKDRRCYLAPERFDDQLATPMREPSLQNAYSLASDVSLAGEDSEALASVATMGRSVSTSSASGLGAAFGADDLDEDDDDDANSVQSGSSRSASLHRPSVSGRQARVRFASEHGGSPAILHTTSLDEQEGDEDLVDDGEDELVEANLLRPSMDIFSAGCLIAEIFLERPLFKLSSLLSYRKGHVHLEDLLEGIENTDVRELVLHMLQLDPEARLSAEEYVQKWSPRAFPTAFAFMHPYIGALNTLNCDVRMQRVMHDWMPCLRGAFQSSISGRRMVWTRSSGRAEAGSQSMAAQTASLGSTPQQMAKNTAKLRSIEKEASMRLARMEQAEEEQTEEPMDDQVAYAPMSTLVQATSNENEVELSTSAPATTNTTLRDWGAEMREAAAAARAGDAGGMSTRGRSTRKGKESVFTLEPVTEASAGPTLPTTPSSGLSQLLAQQEKEAGTPQLMGAEVDADTQATRAQLQRTKQFMNYLGMWDQLVAEQEQESGALDNALLGLLAPTSPELEIVEEEKLRRSVFANLGMHNEPLDGGHGVPKLHGHGHPQVTTKDTVLTLQSLDADADVGEADVRRTGSHKEVSAELAASMRALQGGDSVLDAPDWMTHALMDVLFQDTDMLSPLLTLVCASMRNCASSQHKTMALDWLLFMGYQLDDALIFERVVPFMLVMLGDKEPRVRLTTLKNLTRMLGFVRTLPARERGLPDYMLAHLLDMPNDTSEIVRVTFAQLLTRLVGTIARLQELASAHEHDATQRQPSTSSISSPEGSPSSSLLTSALSLQVQQGKAEWDQLSYDRQLDNVRMQTMEMVNQLMTDSSSVVRKALLQHVSELCAFMGNAYTLSNILPLFINLLNQDDKDLRITFFSHLSDVSDQIGQEHTQVMVVPCVIGALFADDDEFVTEKAINALGALADRGLISHESIVAVATDTAPLLLHPSIWIRYAVIGLFASAARLLGPVKVYRHLLPLTLPFVHKPILVITELNLLSSLRPPVSRFCFDKALSIADILSERVRTRMIEAASKQQTRVLRRAVNKFKAPLRKKLAPKRSLDLGGRGKSGDESPRSATSSGASNNPSTPSPNSLRVPIQRVPRRSRTIDEAASLAAGGMSFQVSSLMYLQEAEQEQKRRVVKGKRLRSGDEDFLPASFEAHSHSLSPPEGVLKGQQSRRRHQSSSSAGSSSAGSAMGEQEEGGSAEEQADEAAADAEQDDDAVVVVLDNYQGVQEEQEEQFESGGSSGVEMQEAEFDEFLNNDFYEGMLNDSNESKLQLMRPYLWNVIKSRVRSQVRMSQVSSSSRPTPAAAAAEADRQVAERFLAVSESVSVQQKLVAEAANAKEHDDSERMRLRTRHEQIREAKRAAVILAELNSFFGVSGNEESYMMFEGIDESMREKALRSKKQVRKGPSEPKLGEACPVQRVPCRQPNLRYSEAPYEALKGAMVAASKSKRRGLGRSSHKVEVAEMMDATGYWVGEQDAVFAHSMEESGNGSEGTRGRGAVAGEDVDAILGPRGLDVMDGRDGGRVRVQADAVDSWRPAGVLVGSSKEHTARVSSIEAAADLCYYVTASLDGSVRLWDVSETAEEEVGSRAHVDLGSGVRGMCVVDTTQRVVAGTNDGKLHVLDVEYPGEHEVDDMEDLMSVSGLGHVQTLDLGEESSVVAVAWDKEASVHEVYYGCIDGKLRGWDLRTRKDGWSMDHPSKHGVLSSFCVGTGGLHMVTGSSLGYMTLWDIRYGLKVQQWRHPCKQAILSLVNFPEWKDGKASQEDEFMRAFRGPQVCAATNGNQCEASVWDVDSGNMVHVFRAQSAGQSGHWAYMGPFAQREVAEQVATGEIRVESSSSSSSSSRATGRAREDSSVYEGTPESFVVEQSMLSSSGFSVNTPASMIVDLPRIRTPGASSLEVNTRISGQRKEVLDFAHAGSREEMRHVMRALLVPRAGQRGMLVTAGTDKAIRVWDLHKAYRSYTMCGYDKWRPTVYRCSEYEQAGVDFSIYEECGVQGDDLNGGSVRFHGDPQQADGQMERVTHSDSISSLTWLPFPHCPVLVSGGDSGEVRLWK